MTRCYIPSPHTTSRSRLPPPSAPPGAPSPDISTAPSPPPGSGARPEPLPSLSVPLPRLGLTVKVLAPQSASGPSPAHKTSRRGLKDWPVRSRLLLLVITPAVAVAVGAFCVVAIADTLRGAPNHSPSIRAVLPALAIGIVMIIILMLASWFTILAARSVLHPLNRLRAGAVKMSRAELPGSAHRVTEDNGEGGPPDSEPIGIDSSDEIGQVAHDFDQMRRE